MTRARMPRPHEVAAARRDPRLLRAFSERRRDPAWRTRGACQTVDPETFFPAPSEPADAAIALCRTCDVQGACLAWALDVGDCHGVWGGTTPRERRAMLVAWRSQGLWSVPGVREGDPAGEGSPPGEVDDALPEDMLSLRQLVSANSP
ncbi:MAG: WhiB family transcriptional regulator [Micromonosporaceae bacterium]|nr:WhiB family transcriptional regulator [Micromonosporaceae bacterium]